jgi:hypothetical protein
MVYEVSSIDSSSDVFSSVRTNSIIFFLSFFFSLPLLFLGGGVLLNYSSHSDY